jgi:hypothetical protein
MLVLENILPEDPARGNGTLTGDGNHDLEAAAYDYLDRGLSFIPLIGKEPVLSRWRRYQKHRPTKRTIKQWLKKYPEMTGWGIITGKVSGGLIIRDFDKPGGYPQWKAEHPELADLPAVQTGSGKFHVWARVEGEQPTKVLPDGEGELRGEVVYTLAPPSLHPDTGKPYRWVVPLPDGPIKVIDITTSGLLPPDTPTDPHPLHAHAVSSLAGRPDQTHACVKVKTVADAIRLTLPTRIGQRWHQLWPFAQMLKAIMPGASMPDLKPHVLEWHRQALPIIRTKDFDTTWVDFCSNWRRIKKPWTGMPSWEQIVAAAKAMPTPAIGLQYDSEGMRLLVGLVATLARLHNGGPFPLSCRKAGKAIGVSHERANEMLHTLHRDRVLEPSSELGNHDGLTPEERREKRIAFVWRYLGDQVPLPDGEEVDAGQEREVSDNDASCNGSHQAPATEAPISRQTCSESQPRPNASDAGVRS